MIRIQGIPIVAARLQTYISPAGLSDGAVKDAAVAAACNAAQSGVSLSPGASFRASSDTQRRQSDPEAGLAERPRFHSLIGCAGWATGRGISSPTP